MGENSYSIVSMVSFSVSDVFTSSAASLCLRIA